MKIKMLVSVSRTGGFHATQGQVIEADAELSAEMVANGWATDALDASLDAVRDDAPAPRTEPPARGDAQSKVASGAKSKK